MCSSSIFLGGARIITLSLKYNSINFNNKDAFWFALPDGLAKDFIGRTTFSCLIFSRMRSLKCALISLYFSSSEDFFSALDSAVSNSFSIWLVCVNENKTEAPYFLLSLKYLLLMNLMSCRTELIGIAFVLILIG